MAFQSTRTSSLVPDTSSDFDVDKLPHFIRFAINLCQSLIDPIVKKHYGQYDSVHVLLLAWGTPTGSTIKELEDLEYFLKTDLNFTTDYYQIARNDAVNEFDSKLEDVVSAYGGANELLIIYYAGHSHLDVAEKTTTSQTARAHDLRELNWSTIENRLNQTIATESNILYILDSAYMPGGRLSSSPGRKELLAASKHVPKSAAVKDYLFTADLLHELRKQIQATGSVNVSTLYSCIIQRQAGRHITKPYHLALSDKASSSSIVLARMRAYDPCTPVCLDQSRNVALCMIQAQAAGDPDKLWSQYISSSRAVQEGNITVHPLDYVKRYECHELKGVHYILVSMPSEVSRKIVKKTAVGRAFIELGIFGSEAAITQEIRDAAILTASLPTVGLLGIVS